MFGSDHASREIKRNREESVARAQKRKDKTNMYSTDNKSILKFKQVSEEELKIIKHDLREKSKKNKLRVTILTLIFTCIILVGIYYILSNIIS